jgi:hypothetical protein
LLNTDKPHQLSASNYWLQSKTMNPPPREQKAVVTLASRLRIEAPPESSLTRLADAYLGPNRDRELVSSLHDRWVDRFPDEGVTATEVEIKPIEFERKIFFSYRRSGGEDASGPR